MNLNGWEGMLFIGVNAAIRFEEKKKKKREETSFFLQQLMLASRLMNNHFPLIHFQC